MGFPVVEIREVSKAVAKPKAAGEAKGAKESIIAVGRERGSRC